MSIKSCKDCKVEKDLSLFGRDKGRKDGLNPYCKACVTLQSRKYRLNHPEKRAKTVKDYEAKNRHWLSPKRKNTRFKKEYGITLERYLEMAE